MIEPDGSGFRRYFRKQGDGESIEHFLAEGMLYRTIVAAQGAPHRRAFTLDQRVLGDYARLLLPRAVGYSAALIDHFFRNDLHAFGDDTSVTLSNFGNEAMNGTVTLYYDDAGSRRRKVEGASWAVSLAPGEAVDDLRFQPPTDPAPQDPARYMMVFTGSLGSEPDAVLGRVVRLPSVMTARLLRHLDGMPYPSLTVRTVDVRTNVDIDESVTAADGTAELQYLPGHTALVVEDAGNVIGPMFWVGDVKFSRTSAGAKRIAAADLDPEGRLTVPIAFLRIDWSEEVEPCTGHSVFSSLAEFVQNAVPNPDGAEIRSSMYIIYEQTFTYADTGLEIPYGLANHPEVVRSLIVPEATGRIGGVVGHIHRHVYSQHNRVQVDAEGRPISFFCLNEYEDVQTLPVTIVEYDPFG